MKFWDGSVMIWEAIKGNGTKIFIRCPYRLNSNGYMDVLKRAVQYMTAMTFPNRTMLRAKNPELYHLSWVM